MMSKADLVDIGKETSMIDSGRSLKNEFIEWY